MGRIEDLSTMRLVAARLAPARRALAPLRSMNPLRAVTPLRALSPRRALKPLKAHPRAVGITVVALLLVALATPLLLSLSQASATQPLALQPGAQRTPTAHPTAHPTHAPSPTAMPAGTPNLAWASAWPAIAESAYVNGLISHMTLDEELGQMLMVGFDGPTMTPGLAALISQYHVGAAILYAVTGNIVDGTQIKKLTHDLQAQASIPLLIATDQEGGGVNRLQSVLGPLPSAYDVAQQGDPKFAKQRGEQDGQELAKLGINLNFAPVVDVLNVPFGEGDIGPRSFGTTPGIVTQMAGAYLSGLQEGHHVAGTLKHFPGLGDVPTDPHAQLYTLTRSLSDLESIDWAPYQALIATGQVNVIMSTHVVVQAVDPTTPASLSNPVLTGILRDQLGFQGVIVTDGIYMGALSKYPQDQVFLKAVQAGNDLICSVGSFDQAQLFVQTIKTAIANGTITKQRIDDSVRRILSLKLHYGVLAIAPPQG